MDTRWRKFFDGAGADIWTVIDYALDIAAEDFPHELRIRRDGFVEKLYAHPSLLSQSNGCLPVVGHHPDDANEDKILEPPEYDFDHVRNDNSDDEERLMSAEYDEAEALTDAMEEESRQQDEILSIKESIADVSEEAEEIMTSLRRLEEMHISVEALKATEIGKEVNALRKHESRHVRSLAKALVRSWKDLVDEWVKSAGDVAAAAMAGSGSTGVDHEEDGLASPPLDPGGLLASTRTASIEMSHFFDDFLDDDMSAGSGPSPPSSNGVVEDIVPAVNKRQQQSRGPRPSSPDSRAPKSKGRVVTSNGHVEMNNGDIRPFQSSGRKSTEIANASDRSANGISRGNSGPGRPIERALPSKANGNGVVRKFDSKPPAPKGNKPKFEQGKPQEPEGEISVAARLEAAKRRLNERYQQAESAKRQRVVQVMELTELPKGGPNRAKLNQTPPKPAAQNRMRPQMRR